MYRVDIAADLNDEDETGYLWTFLDEARDPARITPGALVVAGDQDAAAVCQVIDLVPAGDGTIVHMRPLPGLVEDCRALVERAFAAFRPRAADVIGWSHEGSDRRKPGPGRDAAGPGRWRRPARGGWHRLALAERGGLRRPGRAVHRHDVRAGQNQSPKGRHRCRGAARPSSGAGRQAADLTRGPGSWPGPAGIRAAAGAAARDGGVPDQWQPRGDLR